MQFKAIAVAAFASSVAAQNLDPNLLNSVSSALGASAYSSVLANLPAELSSAKAGQVPSWVSQLPPSLQSALAAQFGISVTAPVTASGSMMMSSGSMMMSSGSGSMMSSESAKLSSIAASASSVLASVTGSHTGSMMSSATGSMASSSPSSSSAAAPTALIGSGLAGAAGLIGLLAL